MKQIVNKILLKTLKLIISVVLGFVWICVVGFFAILPTFFGIENNTLGIILMLIPLLSPILLFAYFNKRKRQEWFKEGKDFLVGMRYLIIVVGILIGVLTLISLFFLTVSTIFYWLAGLGITTLLILILIVLILK